MYSTIQVSNILEVNERTVRYYISEGHLKATLDGGNYVISIKDLTNFENDYFYTKRLSNKGNGKKLNEVEFNRLTSFVEAIKSGISMTMLITEYEKLQLNIPSLKVYLIFERNLRIKKDQEIGFTYRQLADKYSLCEKSISNILNENK